MSKPKIADFITRIAITADSEQTVSYARGLMHEYKVRHLPVLDGRDIVGVITERDILLLDSMGTDSDETPLAKTIRGQPYTVDIEADLATVAREMYARRIGSAIVTSNDKVVGMFTTTDALSALAAALSD